MKIKLKKNINWLEVLFCIMLSVLIMLAFWAGLRAGREEYTGKYKNYTIMAGDTIYSIAKDLNTNKDLNKIIYEIRQDNQITDCGNLKIRTRINNKGGLELMKTTQIESLKQLDKAKRYAMIIDLLKQYKDGFTAREMALMFGIQERNYVAPRLTELEKKGIVKVSGGRYDPLTDRTVSVYVLGGGENESN